MATTFRWAPAVACICLSLVLCGARVDKALALEITAVGRAASINHVDIATQVAGEVTEVNANLGDRVKRGQALVQLDTLFFDLDVRTARAKLDFATARALEARRNHERALSLTTSNVGSGRSRDGAEAAAATTAADVRARQAALDLALYRLEKTAISAPFEGWVSRRLVGVGSFLRVGETVISLSDLSKAVVRFDLIERDVARVEKGNRAVILFDALPEHRWVGQITRVGMVGNSRSDTFPVEITIENPDSLIRDGYTASITIISGE